MASSISDYLWRHGVNLAPNFSEEWACDSVLYAVNNQVASYFQRRGVNLTLSFSEEWAPGNWHNWEAVEEHLKLRPHKSDVKTTA